jgi:glycosyltransferase involved in cell wall biosynthesis
VNLSEITANVLVKNEIYFIESVLTPLVKHLKEVIVFDTGSDDGTTLVAEKMGCRVIRRNAKSPAEVSNARQEMCSLTNTPWIFLCDGDELYEDSTFEQLKEQEMPDGKKLGFTPMVSVDWKDGSYWLLNDNFSRTAIYPKETRWKGTYPFEVPHWFDIPACFHYFNVDYAYHLHRLDRSPLDAKVFMRKDKQYLFSLQENPNLKYIKPIKLPLVSDPHA